MHDVPLKYVPAGQGVHDASLQYEPAGQEHLVAPVLEVDEPGQGVHDVCNPVLAE